MRDPKRIVQNWEKIAKIHERLPDWRMGQLLLNVLSRMDNDPFYMEDDEFVETFEKTVLDFQGKKQKREENNETSK